MSISKLARSAPAANLVTLPPPDPSTQREVERLRRMVQSMAELLVECGVVDASMVEGRLHQAAETTAPSVEDVSLKPVGLWTRLFGRKRRPDPSGVVPTAMMPVDQTVPVEKLPFEVQSLYDESGASKIGSAPKKPLEQTKMGACNRCWRRAPIDSGSLCARCAVSHG